MVEKDAKNKAVKAPLTDSEGTPVVSIKDETVKEEKSLNKAAKGAYEEELEADAKARAEEDAKNKAAWDEFLENR